MAELLNFFLFYTGEFLLILEKLFERSALFRDLGRSFGRKTGLESALLVLFVVIRLLADSVFQMGLFNFFVILETHG